ncbi:MAG: hypothetical protein KAI24_09660 [Planctomycetes bacterium]|nr:hypothetical protein [Planctomycetota bacterium]
MKWCAMILAASLSLAATGDAPRPPQEQSQGQGPDPAAFGRALADYRAGRFEQASAAFSSLLESVDAEGDADGDAELRLDAALCALQLLRSRDAEQLVAPLTERERWRADAAFVLGMAARQHAERAVIAAKLPDAEPMAWVMATRAMQRSELQFRLAVRLRPEWGEAVRNLERTLRRRAEVEAEREAAQPQQAKQEEAPDQPPPPPEPQPDRPPEVVIPEVAMSELSAAELQKLQERVRAQQQQKVRDRQQRGRANGATGGRDW